MTRTSPAASSQWAWRRAMVALQAALVVAQSGCGSGNTGSLDLFSPARQQARPNGTEDARVGVGGQPPDTPIGAGGQPPDAPVGAGGQPPDARVVPPGPSCPDGGCPPVDECLGDVDCHSGSASRCDVVSSRCVECLTVSECAGGERPLCDSASHMCAECLSDVDCADPSKPGCFKPTGRCEECSTDAQCSGGETCDQTDGHCR